MAGTVLVEQQKAIIRIEHRQKPYHEILDLPPSALQGLTSEADEIFELIQIKTVRDLGIWKYYQIAKAINQLVRTEEIGKRNPASISNLNQALMKEWETKSFRDIVKAPISILQGLTEKSAAKLGSIHEAGYPISVEQLGNWKYCRYAESLIALDQSKFITRTSVVNNSVTKVFKYSTVTQQTTITENSMLPAPEPIIEPLIVREIPQNKLPQPTSSNRRSSTKKRRRSSSTSDFNGTPNGQNFPKVPRNSTPKTSVKKVSRFFNALENDVQISAERRRTLGRQLHQLVILDEIEAIELLLRQGADPDGGGSVRPPLYTAVDLKNLSACEILMEYGASMVFPVLSDGEQTNPLKLALQDLTVATVFVERLQKLESSTFDNTNGFNELDNESPSDEEPPRKRFVTTPLA